jgi:hypothetical protein
MTWYCTLYRAELYLQFQDGDEDGKEEEEKKKKRKKKRTRGDVSFGDS